MFVHAPRQQADDESLALAAKAGDPMAFAELYRRYQPVLVGYVRRRIDRDITDVVQNTFSSIYTGLAHYRGPRFFPWAFRICVNAVTDEQRRRQRRGKLISNQSFREALTEQGPATPEEELIAERLSTHIRGAFDKLPQTQRVVFLLARVEGLSYAEIGELLDIPVGTVKSRMFNAVKTLWPSGEST